MRILMVTETFHPVVGGSESAIRYLSDALTDLGHEVMVAVMNVPAAANPSKKFAFRVISPMVGPFNLKTWGKIAHCKRIVAEFKPDIVNAHFLFESGMVGTVAAHSNRVPSVVTERGRGLFSKPGNLLQRILFTWWIRGALKADAFIATSQEMADMAKQRFGIDILAISNGVETDLFTPSRRTDIHSILHAKPEQRILFCARRLVPKNGIEYIVRALPLIRQAHDAILVLAAPLSGDYEKLKTIAAQLGVTDHIRFIGPVSHEDLPMYFASADAVVQPSIAEARSLACLEAMASGAVVVATDTGGLKELITHKENGYLVPAFEESTYQVGAINETGVKNLAEAVQTILSDAALSDRLRKGARTYAQTCSWKEIAKQSLVIYQRAIDSFRTS